MDATSYVVSADLRREGTIGLPRSTCLRTCLDPVTVPNTAYSIQVNSYEEDGITIVCPELPNVL